jgi:hypothetical protein
MLVRYCAAHLGNFGYSRLLGVRWKGWAVSTVGGFCEACRERERERRETAPYGEVLIPVPVEPGPRMLVRRVIVATVAATAAAMVTTAALLVAQPPYLIPSGGEPGHFSSGAGFAGSPSPAQASTETERPAASRPSRHERVVSRAVAPRAAHPSRHLSAAVEPVRVGGGCVAPALAGASRVAAAPAALARPITLQAP